MLMTTRFEATGTQVWTHEVSRPIAPQDPVSNQPSPGVGDSVLDRLARRLRPTNNGLGTFFSGSLVQGCDGPRGLAPLDDGALHRADPHAREPHRIQRRRQRALAAVGGQPEPEPRGNTARLAASGRTMAVAQLSKQFTPPGGAKRSEGAAALIERLLGFSTAGATPYETPLLIGAVLSRVAQGSPQRAGELLDVLQSAEPRGDAFMAQLALARCQGPGIDGLLALCRPAGFCADPALAAVQREAYAAQFRAADHLCLALPPELRPGSLAACIDLAREMARRRADAAAPGGPEAWKAAVAAERAILVDGLVCASMLVEDPAADATPAQQCAYLALRNGIVTQEVLARAQARLFKLNTYVGRACERGTTRLAHALQRAFGYQRSPLHALTQLGTAQSKTRHPADDLALRCAVMDAFAAQLDARLGKCRTSPRPTGEMLRQSIRIAAVRHWKKSIVDHGWSDRLPVDAALRRAIVRDASAQLGCSPERVQAHPGLRKLQSLQADVLESWARQEGIDYSLPLGGSDTRSFEQAMLSFRRIQNGGDIILRRPAPEQARELLHNAIEDTRQTYSVSFAQGNSMGLQASVTDILAATPVPLGVGPSVAVLGSRSAYLQVGSNVHGGQLHVGSSRSGRLELGVAGFVGKKVGDVLNLGLTCNLTPLQVDHTRTRAIVLRTRMNVFGSADPDAWRALLLQAFDAITWKDGESGPPDDPAQMWSQLARRFYKNPNLSIDDLHSTQTSGAGSATATLGARVALPSGLQVGPGMSVGGSKVYQNVLRQHDKGGNRRTELHSNSAGHTGSASVGLTAIAPSVTGGLIHENAGHAGTTQALAMSSANAGSKGVTFLRNAAGVTIRLVTDQGRVDADYTVMDTETGTAKSFVRHIDAHRAEWLTALGGGPQAAHDLDAFLSRLLQQEKRGNVTYGERRRLTPLAARKIDYLRAMGVAMADDGDAGQRRHYEAEVTRVLSDPRSWDPRSMWVLDLNLNVSTKGPSIVLHLVSRKTSSAPRQSGVLVAVQAPNRSLADQEE